MSPPRGVPVKVCGLTRPEDARAADGAGAAFLGVVLAPGGRRSITASRAVEVLEGTSGKRVGVFVDASVEEISRDAGTAGLDVVQLHGDEEPEVPDALRSSTGCAVWKAVRVRAAEDLLRAVDRYASRVDALLLDAWSASARGGTGERFSWEDAARHRNQLPPDLPLVVAGGLRSDNVREAIRLLRPDAVDVSSGVESAPGRKDAVLIRTFLAAAGGRP